MTRTQGYQWNNIVTSVAAIFMADMFPSAGTAFKEPASTVDFSAELAPSERK